MPSLQSLNLGVLVSAPLIIIASTGCVGTSGSEEEATAEASRNPPGDEK